LRGWPGSQRRSRQAQGSDCSLRPWFIAAIAHRHLRPSFTLWQAMGKDVFGKLRFACQVAGCSCAEYLCVIDAMTDEERAMTVVHHPRNHPGYVTCTCTHQVHQHATNPLEVRSAGPLQSVGALLDEMRASSQTREALNGTTLLELVEEAEASDRPAFLAALGLRGVEKLSECQSILNALAKARRAGRIATATP
jgi:hypothetical protein